MRFWWSTIACVAAVPVKKQHPHAVAGLVISGHKAGSSRFVEQSACAALTMFWSVRNKGKFRGDLVLMAGPLGPRSPHDLKSWKSAPSTWRNDHDAARRQLERLVEGDGVRVWDLVPLLLSSQYPAMKRNLNYMKLAIYELPHDKVMFVDLDVVVVGDLTPFFVKKGELVGYRTCTAPVNSGFFVVSPRDRHLAALDKIILGNRCPCHHDRLPFAERGYDSIGSIRDEVQGLWAGSELCRGVVERRERTWQFAGAGTGQGLMYYFFGLKRKSYSSFTYSQLPIVHYNSPGSKPWSSHAQLADSNPTTRQHCDFVWWRAWVLWRRRHRNATFCDDLLLPNLRAKKAANHFPMPACCRTCPGGGHFANARPCNNTAGVDDYARTRCRPAAQLLRSLR